MKRSKEKNYGYLLHFKPSFYKGIECNNKKIYLKNEKLSKGAMLLKKIICLFLPLLLLLNVTTAFAASRTEIYSDTVYATQGDTVTVPVKIKNNAGIMGFRLTFKYPNELNSPEVLRSALLNEGLLNDSITEATKDSFDVVWSNTQNVIGDGTVLLLSFKVSSDAQNGNYKIDVFYNQADTFNEDMQDVFFDCQSLKIIIGKNTIETTKNDISNPVTQKPIKDIDSLFLKKTFEKALDFLNVESFEFMSDKDFEKFKELVSKEFVNYGASGDELDDKSKDEIEEIYNKASKDAFVDSVVNTVDGDVINNAIKENLSAVGAENIESVPPEKQKEFVDGVVKTLTDNGAEINELPDSFTGEQAIDAIESVSKKNESETEVEVDDFVPKEKPQSYVLYVAVGVAAVAIIAVIAVLIIKRKIKKTNEEDKQ